MNVETQTPYANLTPELILDAVDSLGYRTNGSLLSLNSYENRVYQVGMEEGPPLIAKFYRPNRWTNAAILEEHQFALELKGHEIPVIAPLIVKDTTLHEFKEFRFALFPRQGGRQFELDNLDHLEWMGRFIGRLHAVSACQPFKERGTINLETYGQKPFQYLLENNFIPKELLANYQMTVTRLFEQIAACYDFVPEMRLIRLHGDCHAGNILWNDAGPQIVDLDDCLMGPAIQDVWMLISGADKDRRLQIDTILEGYEEFFDFDRRELHLIEALRTLRMMHYSAWLAKRWEDPAFPLNFPWFNTGGYWQQQLEHLREQVAVLDVVLDKE